MSDPIKEFEEMYLKTLYEFYAEEPHKPIRNSRIAKEMGVSQASSSEMIPVSYTHLTLPTKA